MTDSLSFPVPSDGLTLPATAYVPPSARALVVLLHGIPSIAPADPDDDGYPGLARRFAHAGFAAAWADMRGARGAPGHFSIEGWVRDARALVDAAKALDAAAGLPVAVVGSSAGGAVASEAARRGAPVDAVVLMAAPAAWLSFASDAPSAVRRITEQSGMPIAPEVVDDPAAWVGEFERVVATNAVAKVRLPVLIVHGTDDDVVPVRHAHMIAEAAPAAELRIIEGAPHQLRRNDEAVTVVLEWLAERFAVGDP